MVTYDRDILAPRSTAGSTIWSTCCINGTGTNFDVSINMKHTGMLRKTFIHFLFFTVFTKSNMHLNKTSVVCLHLFHIFHDLQDLLSC